MTLTGTLRKVFATTLAAAMLVGTLAGCSSNANSNASSSAKNSSQTSTTEIERGESHDPSIVNRENSAVPGTPAEGKAQYGGGTAREFHPLPRKCAAQYAIVYATVYRTGTFFASPFGSVRKTYLRYRRS